MIAAILFVVLAVAVVTTTAYAAVVALVDLITHTK